jgi:hypothetical protein
LGCRLTSTAIDGVRRHERVAEASIDIHQQLRLSENSVRQKSFNVFIFAGSYADTDVA